MRARDLPLLLVAATVLAAPPAAAGWEVRGLGGTAFTKDLAIGDGDRDGTPEVYAATERGVRQWVPDGTGWRETAIANETAYSIAVGDGDRDGEPEVYAGLDAGRIMQYTWTGSGWTADLAADLGSAFQLETVTLGDLEQDGKRELYTSTGEGKVVKVFFQATWKALNIGNADWASTSWVGDGDRDGRPELYLGTYDTLYQVESRGDGRWKTAAILRTGCCIDGVVVADGEGDGRREVYLASWDGTVRKVWLESGTWVWRNRTVAVLPDLGRDLTTADIDGDGRAELYAACGDGTLQRVAWDGTWRRSSLGDTGEAPMVADAAGDGDRDGEVEVYGGVLGAEAGVFEFDP